MAFAGGPQAEKNRHTPTAQGTESGVVADAPATIPFETATPTAMDAALEVPVLTPTVLGAAPGAIAVVPTASPAAVPASPQLDESPPPARLSGHFVPDEVIVRFRPLAEVQAINECVLRADAAIESEIEELSVYLLKVPDGGVAQAIAILALCPDARYVEPNYLAAMADTIPSDGGWVSQYGLVNVRAPQGWDFATGSTAVTIAIVDTGLDLGHPDLASKVAPGHDFVNGDSVAQDDNGHGTRVAGVAAATTNNGVGMAGVSWGALIMPVKVLDAFGNGTFIDVAAGITWAADNGAQVINLSLGGTSSSAVLEAAVDYAYNKGVVVVAATGNTGSNFVLYPARLPHVIAVAATDSTNVRAGFSNFGPEVILSAPGVSIFTTSPGGSYGFFNGTSMAAPFVSGLAAILRGIPGIGSPDVITWYMQTTALDLGASGVDALYGHGLIQMDRAIQLALPPAPEEESHRATNTPQGSYPYTGPGLTFTPAPSLTALATAAAFQATPPSFTAIPPGSETPELSAQGNDVPAAVQQAPALSRIGDDWPIGCSGLGLVLVGAVLASILSRRQRRRPRHHSFRLP